MAKSKGYSKLVEGASLEEKVKAAVPRLWNELAADVDWPVTVADAVELCLDASRLVMNGYMSKEDYNAMCKLDNKMVDKWAKAALKGYF